jgi:hypothetical protein
MTIVHVIRPTAVYSVESARSALGLTKTTIGREIRLGRLRVAKRAGRYFILGTWLLEWLETGEIRRRKGECDGKSRILERANAGLPAGLVARSDFGTALGFLGEGEMGRPVFSIGEFVGQRDIMEYLDRLLVGSNIARGRCRRCC